MKKKKRTKKTGTKKNVIKKSRKKETLFNNKEMVLIKKHLLKNKDDIIRTVAEKKSLDISEPEVGDSIDTATHSLDKEMLFELSDNERAMLDDIEAALRKINNKTYGICELCRKPISKKRLKVLPSARYCMACQTSSEKLNIG